VLPRTFNGNTTSAAVYAPSIIIGCSKFHPTLSSRKFGSGWALPSRLIVSNHPQDSPCIVIGQEIRLCACAKRVLVTAWQRSWRSTIRAAARPPNKDQRVVSASPAASLEQCVRTVFTAPGQQVFCRLSEPACCLSTALDFPLSGHTSDPPRPARAPATRTQCTAAHTAQRARRSDSSCLQAIHNFQASEVSNRRICVFRMDAQRHIEPAASLYPFPLE
jgi:hypothetical protein